MEPCIVLWSLRPFISQLNLARCVYMVDRYALGMYSVVLLVLADAK